MSRPIGTSGQQQAASRAGGALMWPVTWFHYLRWLGRLPREELI